MIESEGINWEKAVLKGENNFKDGMFSSKWTISCQLWERIADFSLRVCSKKKGKKVLHHCDLNFWHRKSCYLSMKRKFCQLSNGMRYVFLLLMVHEESLELSKKIFFQKPNFLNFLKNLSIYLVDRNPRLFLKNDPSILLPVL